MNVQIEESRNQRTSSNIRHVHVCNGFITSSFPQCHCVIQISDLCG